MRKSICILILQVQVSFPVYMPLPEDLKTNHFLTDLAQNVDQQSENGRKGLREGDIDMEQVATAGRNGKLDSRWDYNIMPFSIDWSGITQQYKSWVRHRIDYVLHWEYRKKLGDCILLCERHIDCPKNLRHTKNYVSITFDNTGCWSGVGKTGGKQILNLSFPGCLQKTGTIAHELMHALGFYHEHTRPDRDSYVNIKESNIIKSKLVNFVKQTRQTAEMYDYYDWNSVMHYDSYAFRKDIKSGLLAFTTKTILPDLLSWQTIKQQTEHYGRGAVVGQRVGLSFCDELKLRRHYGKPGVKGGRKCNLWTPRTCACKFINKNDEYSKTTCQKIIEDDPERSMTQYDRASTKSASSVVRISILLATFTIVYLVFE